MSIMDDVQLKTTLQAVGKQCYMNCFERAVTKSGELVQQDIIECNPGVIYSPTTMSTKKSGIKRIFKSRRHHEALQICNRSRVGTTSRWRTPHPNSTNNGLVPVQNEEPMHLSMPYITIDPHRSGSGSIVGDGTPEGSLGPPPQLQTVAGGMGLIRGAPEGQPHQIAAGSILVIKSGSSTPDGPQGHSLPTMAAILSSTSESPLPLPTPGNMEAAGDSPARQPHYTSIAGSGLVRSSNGDTSGLCTNVSHLRSNNSVPAAVSIGSTSKHPHQENSGVPLAVVLTDGSRGTDGLAEAATLENVRVSGVETLDGYNKCILSLCGGEVVPDRTDPELGTCSQCGMMQRMTDTETILGASMVIGVGHGEFIQLRAFDETIGLIAQRPAAEVDKKALLKAEAFNISHRDGEIVSVTR